MPESIPRRNEPPPASARKDENILLIRLKHIGDVLFTLPAVHAVRERFRGARITFFTSKANAPLIQGFRDVNNRIELDHALYRSGNPKAILLETISLLRRLRREKFSLVVDFQGYGETALLTWCTRAPERWGMLYQPARRWAYTRGVSLDRRVHPAERNVSLLQQCGLPPARVVNEFVVPEAALTEARHFFSANGLDAIRPTLFIQPFTSRPAKNWPLDRYIEVGQYWQRRGLQIVFGGGPAERAALEPARREGFALSTGPLLLDAGLVKLSTIVLGGDTGLLHLAVAMGKRVVMIMVSNAPGTAHPFQHLDWAVTPPHDRIISSIKVDAVIKAFPETLGEMKPRVIIV